MAVLAVLLAGVILSSVICSSSAHHIEVDIRAPPFAVDTPDSYVCTAVQLPPKPHKLIGVRPFAKQEVVHHILLFGCAEPHEVPKLNETTSWRCDSAPICASGASTIIYGWGRNAPEYELPAGVGFSVGRGTSIQYIVAQLHFLEKRPATDNSGVTLMLKPHAVPYAAGLLSFASNFVVPPNTPSHLIETSCCFKSHQPLTAFAVRVHTHLLGRSVYMKREAWNHTGDETLIERSPQLPQGFVPTPPYQLWSGDRLQVTCNFNSTSRDTPTHAGPTHTDEMCNMYLMVYAPTPYIVMCDNGMQVIREGQPGSLPRLAEFVKDPSPFWKPPQPHQDDPGQVFGDATSVTVAADGTLWVLYRGTRVWTYQSFDTAHHLKAPDPVAQALVAQLDPDTGRVLRRWGAAVLFMPHMITVDQQGNVWVVDVALHQVIKFDADGNELMRVGKKLEPGSSQDTFCMPTQVAVLRDGSFVVSDGYCNSRVVKFDANGTFLGEARHSGMLAHSVLVDECEGKIYVASREAGSVLTFRLDTLEPSHSYGLEEHGLVWALRMGPYGEQLALMYKAGKPAKLINIQFPEMAWSLPGTEQLSPHDMALGAAPVVLSGAGDRLFALYVSPVGQTCLKGCGPLLKYVLVPQGLKLPDPATLPLALATPEQQQQRQEQQHASAQAHSIEKEHVAEVEGSVLDVPGISSGTSSGSASSMIEDDEPNEGEADPAKDPDYDYEGGSGADDKPGTESDPGSSEEEVQDDYETGADSEAAEDEVDYASDSDAPEPGAPGSHDAKDNTGKMAGKHDTDKLDYEAVESAEDYEEESGASTSGINSTTTADTGPSQTEEWEVLVEDPELVKKQTSVSASKVLGLGLMTILLAAVLIYFALSVMKMYVAPKDINHSKSADRLESMVAVQQLRETERLLEEGRAGGHRRI